MREFERIYRITSKIKQIWSYHPDMRFFQFLQYLLSKIGMDGRDLFYYEDTDFEKDIDMILEDLNRDDKSEYKTGLFRKEK